MTRVEDHDPLIWQHQEGGVVVVIRLKTRTNQYFSSAFLEMIYLCGFDRSVHINVLDIGAIDTTLLILVVQCTRISKPSPGTLLCNGAGGDSVVVKRPAFFHSATIKCGNDTEDDKNFFLHGENVLKKIKPDSYR